MPARPKARRTYRRRISAWENRSVEGVAPMEQSPAPRGHAEPAFLRYRLPLCRGHLFVGSDDALEDGGRAGEQRVDDRDARYRPSCYTMLSTIQDLAWMSVVPTSLAIGNTTTGWPGNVSPLIAMLDTGGGPVMLSDPNGYVWPKTWPNKVTCPSSTKSSVNCKCIAAPLQISLAAAMAARPMPTGSRIPSSSRRRKKASPP